MKERLLEIKIEAEQILKDIVSLEELEQFRVKYMGKKGIITEISKQMKTLSVEEKPIVGQLINEVRDTVNLMLEEKKNILEEHKREEQLKNEVIDITMPGEVIGTGTEHPVTETLNFLKDIFVKMGFDVVDGPEIEKVEYNFDALNIPLSHPSRDLTDTFYIDEKVILRTQTSPVQIRYMLKNKAPFRMICPGKVYRPDYDVSHTPMFHQMEGLVIGENVSFADLKGILTKMVTEVFGDTEVRFRPHFFPFTEPSAEMDVRCNICHGDGCRVCKGSGWLEIMGCGMVDPEVLKAVGYDDENVSGFAFGMGIERITMLRHAIDDLRAFFENDIRFLKQF